MKSLIIRLLTTRRSMKNILNEKADVYSSAFSLIKKVGAA